ncbi:MBL fold metallo-hydrolase [Paenibacillus harenae]|uniref:MBL fold metallo-hydrolase n=1 Tax=Paenibacillus harenae TaxID=306543 RepID=UPI00278F80DB|nr:MBL fold metallo-hydrolase [Paenibacillus harenae]MDQ0058009.1 phosphoribosyl 1,2-cyclic phosphate phosphodiesterase [Paenibacillus harenae]
MTKLIFRGTGDAMGVPRVYCECPVCEEARTTLVNKRYRSSLQIVDEIAGKIFIDCGPDWAKQMEAALTRNVDAILITHAHFDHIGGLVEWADACRWLGKKGIAYSPTEVTAEILARFPWLPGHIEFRPFDAPITIGNWHVRSWRVNHGKNGYSYAFRFDHKESGVAWAYCSDSIGLSEHEQEPLYGLDMLIFGTSFYEEPFAYDTRSVYDVTEALALIQKWKPRTTYFTHMSHDIDLRHSYPLPDGVSFAYTGLELEV